VTADVDSGLHISADGTRRCAWCGDDPLYVEYHDREWGFPVDDDRRLFEKLCLEGFQAGLSWLAILRRRENLRKALAGFDPATLAQFGPADVDGLLRDSGIIRHRGKIESAINNARRTLELIDECGSLAAFVWRFEPQARARPSRIDAATLRDLTRTPESTALSRALKQRGYRFVGPVTAYAFMQAMGLVNDHVEGCVIRESVAAARAGFSRPN
jgi:DNA-3-methyladenine glycosylase I